MLLSSVFVCMPDTWQRRSTVLGQVRVAYVQWYQFIHPPGNLKSCMLSSHEDYTSTGSDNGTKDFTKIANGSQGADV